jgi:hypothetical protein
MPKEEMCKTGNDFVAMETQRKDNCNGDLDEGTLSSSMECTVQ